MTETRLDRMVVRCRVDDEPGRSRATAVLSALSAGALDDAVDAALTGVGPAEQVAVRRVDVAPVQLSAADPVDDAAATWAAQIGAAVLAAVETGGDDDVVRYPSRAAAVTDLATRAAAGDLRRAWAWSRLGLWPGASVPTREIGSAVLAALAGEPQLVAPVLAAVAAAGRLPDLARRLPAGALAVLADLVWRRAGDDVPVPLASSGDRDAAGADPRTAHLAATVRARSTVLPLGGAASAADRRAVVVLAVAETEPALLGTDLGAAVAAAVAAVLAAAPTDSGAGPPEPPSASVPAPRPVDPDLAAARRLPELARAPRPAGATRHAGLLFLLHLVDDGLDEMPRARLRAGLAALADELADRRGDDLEPLAPDDPARLAFCGLPPDSEPPEPGDVERFPATEGADAVLRGLRTRLAGRRLDERADADLLRQVVDRPGVVRADPGWLEVELRLDDVDTDLRTAGLDLDPGPLSWLGCTVVFCYG
jgi:hypothetical protein